MKKHLKRSVVITILVVLLLTLTVPVAFASGGSGGTYHTVYYGETLYSIGRYYGVNPYYIAQVNNLYNPDYIYAGQVLYIPVADYQRGCYQGCYDYSDDGYKHGYDYGGYNYVDYGYGYDYGDGYDYGYGHGYKYGANYHVVKYGETLTSIAYYYGVSPWAIAKANRIYNLHRIYAGQVLYIPSGGDPRGSY